ncbi:hypothetical protein PHYBLDRAFT_172991 [Phycomyces blakesleeanus NRRL 1555(-)]|uniref:Uncharacterized protein n=1 Tax=Phycomyces blakesleeanus (strain ATCC 8743b / DSM 1359 / FGSC 10004 / NBRC 33097 / NRRL 1555) TaxID=763407 RepID=A0A163D436_PHYB8|nr:hypothetical protein PHYBLDRAFT_172991 [Phycomyces blakesleeanus NRRL 1555(-)]OAD68570.1 hypothetical protein PHYBLDRAFT_172991 [Phycomyces blakesleeanus NRRL 1555(-)]|eukprot:XP_018286610.1 hypothetical protein PHYBLDRAFT_172991 [Phycomyces blakesleeanus NRRL 1555(-)]
MAPNCNADNKYKCYCSVCRVRYGGYNTVSAQTLKRHEKAEKIVELMQNNIQNEIIEETFEVESNEDTMDYIFDKENYFFLFSCYFGLILIFWQNRMTMKKDLPLSESNAVFGIEGNEYTGRNDFDNEEYETDGEMSDDEGFFHHFIVVAIILFVSLYVVDEGAVILILIVNKVLELFNDSFRLPLSVSGLKQLAGFGDLTKRITKYTACGKCHTIYDNDKSVPLCCISPKFGGSSLCSTTLFKARSESRIPKKAYIYYSVISSLKIFFCRPNFENNIDSWNCGPKYFDVVCCTIVNPMHNLFLGTAKRMMERWVADGIIDNKKLVAMQKAVEKIVLPPDYISLGTKIAKGFPYMKADKWKSWCLACRILVMPSICESDIATAHKYLEDFCKKCETLYSLDLLSPNIHLHLHLQDTTRDFGPVYGYWLFSFE